MLLANIQRTAPYEHRGQESRHRPDIPTTPSDIREIRGSILLIYGV